MNTPIDAVCPRGGHRLNAPSDPALSSPSPLLPFAICHLPLLLISCALLNSPAARAQEAAPSEFQLKAAFIYNFAKFVEWPAESFPTPHSPFVIGIIGDNPFEDTLAQTVLNKQINGHPFQVVQFKTLADLKSCHILFVSLSERKRLAEILRPLRGASVLTVSDLDHFLPAGGMIQFLMEGNKVRFAINDTTAKTAGLRISSKLLNLAKRPEREGGP